MILVPDISRVDAAVRGMRRCNTPQCTLGAVGRPSGPLVVQGLRSGRAGGGVGARGDAGPACDHRMGDALTKSENWWLEVSLSREEEQCVPLGRLGQGIVRLVGTRRGGACAGRSRTEQDEARSTNTRYSDRPHEGGGTRQTTQMEGMDCLRRW